MRISDWSSDVCSSDLQLAPQRQVMDHLGVVFGIDDGGGGGGEAGEVGRAAGLGEHLVALEIGFQRHRVGDLAALDQGQRRFVDEIGRASCRESVCQYV